MTSIHSLPPCSGRVIGFFPTNKTKSGPQIRSLTYIVNNPDGIEISIFLLKLLKTFNKWVRVATLVFPLICGSYVSTQFKLL